jgi:hypothetical protein
MAHPKHKSHGQRERSTSFEARPAESVPVLEELPNPDGLSWRPAARVSLIIWVIGVFVLGTFLLYDLITALLFR